jgi:iron complex outermembrane recepter protein
MRILRQTTSLAAMAVAFISAAPVFAQDAAPESASASDEGAGDVDILVTAQRRTQDLQDVAIAVDVVSGDQLVAAGVSDPQNLQKLVPALVTHAGGAGSGTNFYIRGVGTSGSNAYAENPIAFHYDGFYISRPTAVAGYFYDLSRIEVLKGPQGTLWGRNATGGAINVIPNRPELDGFSANALFGLSNYNGRQIAGMVNLPISDSLGVRIAGQVIDRDGYLSDGYDDEVGQAVRAQLLYEVSPDWTLTLGADYFHQGGKGTGAVMLPFYDPEHPWVGGADPRAQEFYRTFSAATAAGVAARTTLPPQADGFNDNEYWGFSGTLDGQIGDGALTLAASYRPSTVNYLSYVQGFGGRSIEENDESSIELRYASGDSGPLQYVAGLFYYRANQLIDQEFFHGPARPSTTQDSDVNVESYAAFGQATFSLTDTFRLVAGLRYSHETRDQDTRLITGRNTSATPIVSTVVGETNFEKVTWRGGIEFDASPDSLIYANVGTGFKSGGLYAGLGDATYGPENLIAYTIGAKNRFFDNMLTLNFELFHWEYDDQQLSYQGPVQTAPGVYTSAGLTGNVGSSTMNGVDLDVIFRPSRRDTFTANVQYLDASYGNFSYLALSATTPTQNCPSTLSSTQPATGTQRIWVVDCSGKPALNAPKWSATVGYEHVFNLSDELDLTIGVRSQIQSGRFMRNGYRPQEYQDSFTMSDALISIGAPDESWTLSGFVNNIENAAVFNGSVQRTFVTGVFYNHLRPPRTYGVRVSGRF